MQQMYNMISTKVYYELFEAKGKSPEAKKAYEASLLELAHSTDSREFFKGEKK